MGKAYHNPRNKFDCKRCKFNWNCGYLCGCHLRVFPEPPLDILAKINKLRIKEEYTPYRFEEHVEKVYERLFTKHYPPSNPIWGVSTTWKYERSSNHRAKDIERIGELLLKCCDVKTGWCGSSVYGHREYFIFYK